MTYSQPEIISLPKILDERGNLSFLEENNHVPFPIERIHWIYDVPGGQTRGGHAYKTGVEYIVALSGSFDVVVKTGEKESRFHLNRSYFGLLVPALFWRHMENFSTNSLALVISGNRYDPDDYIRNMEDLKKLRQDAGIDSI